MDARIKRTIEQALASAYDRGMASAGGLHLSPDDLRLIIDALDHSLLTLQARDPGQVVALTRRLRLELEKAEPQVQVE
jgi:hypothetical protein